MAAVSTRGWLAESSGRASAGTAAPGVCPFCGGTSSPAGSTCPDCGTKDTSAARERAKSTVGPWQLLDPQRPSAPGINYQTLRDWIAAGRVNASSVVRGPTTAQLWKPAGKVKGLSREFGLCFSCDAAIDPSAALCPHCNRSQTLPFDPDMLLDSSSPIPLPDPKSPLSTQSWVEETRARETAAPISSSRRRPVKRDLLLTPSELAKVFQLNAGPVATVDHRPRRSARPAIKRLGLRAGLTLLLLGASLVAMRETLAAGPLAWQWVRRTLLSQSPIAVLPPTSPPAPAMPAIATAPLPNNDPAPANMPSLARDDEPSDTSPEQTVHDLWTQALAAESDLRFAVAVGRYEQILSYPKSYWPANATLRLRLARQEAAGGTH